MNPKARLRQLIKAALGDLNIRKIKTNYDSDFDVLYISIIPNEPSIGSEKTDGVVIRRSRSTGEFVGITIFDFKKRLAEGNFEGIVDYLTPTELASISQKYVN